MTMPYILASQAQAGSMLEYANQTVVHPLGLLALMACGIALIFLPRRHAILAFLVMACFIAPAQRLALFGLDFNFIRIIVIFGWIRVLMRTETSGFRWTGVDAVMIAFAVVNTVAFTVLFASPTALVNRLGASFDTIGMYFLFRMLIRSWEDLRQAVRWAVLLVAPVALAFLVEKSTARNLFAFLGGVPEITLIREGRLRCQGAFAHPILAGCFWASLLPLIGAMWFRSGADRVISVVGVVGTLIIVYTSSSSTPVLAVGLGGLGMLMYVAREYMRYVRWGVALTLFGLHMVMVAPVWHLISRVSAVGGSTGWHRFHLIDNFINHWDEWILIGTRSTAHWGWGLEDVTNQYVLEGVRGGALSLVLFLAAIVMAFSRAGRLWRRFRPGSDRLFAWALGVCLFVHCMNFIAVSYFGQITILWYLTLAAIVSLSLTTQTAPVTRFDAARPRFRADGQRPVELAPAS